MKTTKFHSRKSRGQKVAFAATL